MRKLKIKVSLRKLINNTYRLMGFENRVLRAFGPKTDEVTGGWRKLHDEDLCNFYSSPSIIRMI
jgi:citrate synthase